MNKSDGIGILGKVVVGFMFIFFFVVMFSEQWDYATQGKELYTKNKAAYHNVTVDCYTSYGYEPYETCRLGAENVCVKESMFKCEAYANCQQIIKRCQR